METKELHARTISAISSDQIRKWKTGLMENRLNSRPRYSEPCLTFFQDYQQIVDAEWDILYDKLDKLVKSGAQVILSKLPIGDVATQYFADRYFITVVYTALCNRIKNIAKINI